MNDVTKQLEQEQSLPKQNIWAAQQILPKIVPTFLCSGRETIYTIHFV